MPAIFVKDYTWRQTSDYVIVYVPIVGHPKKIDFFLIDDYLKASFPPFIVEIFLWANVIEKNSVCTVTDEKAIFKLQKSIVDVHWPTLEIENIDKEFKRECRNRALERAHVVAENTKRERNEMRQNLQREAVKAQININTEMLNKIERLRNAHREEAMKEFEDFRKNSGIPILNDIQGQLQTNRKAYRPPLKGLKEPDNTAQSPEVIDTNKVSDEIRSNAAQSEESDEVKEEGPSKNIHENEGFAINEKIFKSPDKEANVLTKPAEEILGESRGNADKTFDDEINASSSEDSESEQDVNIGNGCMAERSIEEVNEQGRQAKSSKVCRKEKGERPGQRVVDMMLKGQPLKRRSIFAEPTRALPLPRKTATINVSFSERVFPTPARESSQLEEQEWLEKQAEARRKIGFDSDDLRPEERDPQWLKDKGDDFFKVRNYLGAISAYTHGIKISDKMASLYVNRSAAQYALGNYYRCLEDCSKALELMEPKCEGNRQSRAKCHARRGAALCKLSAPQHGIPELEAALKLMPDNESVKRDLILAKQYFNMEN